MPDFQCGSPVCHSKFSAKSKDELMAQVAEHVRSVHNIPVVPTSILQYLEANAVTEDGAAQPAR
jgi:predicted small metal-binding protein